MCRDSQQGEEDQRGIDITNTHTVPLSLFSFTHTCTHTPALTETQTVSDRTEDK